MEFSFVFDDIQISASNGSRVTKERKQKEVMYWDEEGGVQKKDKKRGKKRKENRKRWSSRDKVRYWIKNLDQLIAYPRNHSWSFKKRDNFFHRMQLCIQTKNSHQCKSFDQRMKNLYFHQTSPIDIDEATIKNLSHINDDTIQNKLIFLNLLISENTNQLIKKSMKQKEGKLEEWAEFENEVKMMYEYCKGEGKEKLNELKKNEGCF